MRQTVQRLTIGAALAAFALAPAVNAGAAGKDGKKKKRAAVEKVEVHDNYYEPAKLRVREGTKIVWKWPSATGDNHDVTLEKGPKRVKRFQSPVAAAAFKYKRKLTKPGKYKIICTLHEEMKMTIVVR